MSAKRGHYRMVRGWMEHPMFERERFTAAQAWCWLIERAAWCNTTQYIGSHHVRIRRGQYACSVRYLAMTWQWSKSRVHRFLKRLENETMIGTAIEPHYTVVTICNYDKYQGASNETGTATGTPEGTPAGRRRDKEERNQENKERNAVPGRTAPPDPERDLFRRGKDILGSTSGGLIKKLLDTKAGDIALARAAVETASTKHNPREYIGGVIRKRDLPAEHLRDPTMARTRGPAPPVVPDDNPDRHL